MYNTKWNGATQENHGKEKFPGLKDSPKYNYDDRPGDPAPMFATLFIRAFRAWYLYPILLILDIELILGALFDFNLEYINRTGDDINFVVRLLQAKETYPTPFSYLARRIYAKRPHLKKFHPDFKFDTECAALSTMEYYCRPIKGDPPLHKLFGPLIEEAF